MKLKKIKTLRRKQAVTAPAVRPPAPTPAPSSASRFDGLSETQGVKLLNELLASGERWVDSEEYRNPKPLGRFTVEYDEDGVPNYLEY